MISAERVPEGADAPERLRLLDAAYTVGLILGLPYLAVRLLLDRTYREGLGERLGSGGSVPEGDLHVWFHGASAGETLAARALYGLMKEEIEGFRALFSTCTYTGRRAALRAYPDCPARYLPIDMSPMVRRVLKRARPKLVVLLEGDIWPNFICAAKSLGTRVAVVNGRFSQRSVSRYLRFRRFFGPAFGAIDLFCLRDEEQRRNVEPLDIPQEKILVTGNIKYDNLTAQPDEAQTRLRKMLGIDSSESVVIAGSTHEGEEEPLLELLSGRGDFRLIVAPRYPHRASRVEQLARGMGLVPILYSKISSGGEPPSAKKVIVVDTVGDLADLYQVGSIAFVGGSLVPRGGQNVLEPAALGLPVVFGTHTFDFKEDVDMLKDSDAAIEVSDGKELEAAVSRLLDNVDTRQEVGKRARDLILDRRGASKITFDRLMGLI